MNTIRVTVDVGECTVAAPEGTYIRWPGRVTPAGLQWWSFAPADTVRFGEGPVLVTVPETVRWLESEFEAHRGPQGRHLRLVPMAVAS